MSPLSGVTLLVNRREGHSACKKLGVGLLVVTVHDWSFAHCKAPVDTTTCSILSSDKIQNGDILVLANPGPLGKMAVKRRERRFFSRDCSRLSQRRTFVDCWCQIFTLPVTELSVSVRNESCIDTGK